jgi:hypothetical protein
MGAEATEFWFVALVSAAVVLPGVVVPLVLAWRGRYLLPTATGLVLTAGWNTGFFYGTGYARCIPGRVIPDDLRYSFGILAGLAICPFVAAGLAGYRDGKLSHGVTIATSVAALNGFLWVVQGDTCNGISSQVTRGWAAPAFPFFMIVTIPFALWGIRAGRRIGSSRSANEAASGSPPS